MPGQTRPPPPPAPPPVPPPAPPPAPAPVPSSAQPPAPASAPTLAAFVTVIARVGLTSFGGGISGWMLRIIVQERQWVTEPDFLTGLALCQVFPGINVVNLSIWLGYRLHGWRGALAGALAMVVPPGVLMVALLSAMADSGRVPWVHAALDGVAAAAVGLGAAMGLRAARRCLSPVPALAPALVLLAVFIGVGVLQLPLLAVAAAAVPISVGIAWRAA